MRKMKHSHKQYEEKHRTKVYNQILLTLASGREVFTNFDIPQSIKDKYPNQIFRTDSPEYERYERSKNFFI